MQIKLSFRHSKWDNISLFNESVDDDIEMGINLFLTSNDDPEKNQELLFSRAEAIELVKAISILLVKDELVIDVSKE